MDVIESATGRCLCGAVTFTARDISARNAACHCGQCRRWSGGIWLATEAKGGVTFEGEENIGVFRSSEWAERGFCKVCGSNLFYRLHDGSMIGLALGAFDDPSPFAIGVEFHVDLKPDGYALAGDHKRLTEEQTIALFAPDQ